MNMEKCRKTIEKGADKVVKTVLVFLIVLMMLFEIMLYYIPHAIYEMAQDVFYNAREAYDEEYYKGAGNHWAKGALAWAKEIIVSGRDTISEFIKRFRKAGMISDGLSDENMENGINIMGDIRAPAEAVYYKLTETKAKYAERRDSVKASFMQSGLLGILRARCMEEMRNDRRFNSKDVFEGVELDLSGCNQDMSDFEALEYLCLYSVLNDQDPSELKLSDYMKWLGYAPGKSKEPSHSAVLRIDIEGTGGQGVYAKPWEGEYMPAYLTAEARSEAEKAGRLAALQCGEGRFSSAYSKAYNARYEEYAIAYGTPGIDLLMTAYVDDFSTPYAYPEYRVLDNGTFSGTAAQYYANASLMESVQQYGNNTFDPSSYIGGTGTKSGTTEKRTDDAGYNGYVVWSVWPVTTTEYRVLDTGGSYDRNDNSGGIYTYTEKYDYGTTVTVYTLGNLQMIRRTQYHVSVTVYEEILHVTYIVGVNIFVRPPKQLIKMSGLLEGDQTAQYIRYLKQYYSDVNIAGLAAFDDTGKLISADDTVDTQYYGIGGSDNGSE